MSQISDCNKFTVLMAVYEKDQPRLLRMALDSVYANTLKPDAFVLVQDGPVGEELTAVISEFAAKPDFTLVKLPLNRGLAYALNTGLQLIKTPYVFRADADDYNLPNRFAKQISTLNSGYDLVGALIMEVDKEGEAIAIRSVPTCHHDIRGFISRRNPFNHMTVAFRHSKVMDAGGYPDIFLKEDYGLWAILVSSGAKVANLNEVLVNATAGSEMYKRRGGLNYVKSEIQIQFFLVARGLQSPFGAIVIGLLRSFVFLMPAVLRGFVYEKFLRKSA